MDQRTWSSVDGWICDRLLPSDPILEAALAASQAAGLPPYNVAPNQGRLLWILARAIGAREILEIGTLGGYSAIWLARALPPGGRLVTLEVDPRHAAVARANLERDGLGDRVELRLGRAADSLAEMIAAEREPFDMVFIDADKPSNPEYLRLVLNLVRPGSLIVGDNVVRAGTVVDPDSTDPMVRGIREFMDLVAAEPRISATAIQTVGSKGYDGFAIAIVE